ncbi:hypothetical protein [Pseudoblastomonas flavescens]|nr:hypothetical protein [Alteriqipengyuania flavescens]WJY19095.1 hypothetical protein QQW98_02325 [Alteriqipengyuania flavescens]
MSDTKPKNKTGKTLLAGALGAFAGFLAMYGFLQLEDRYELTDGAVALGGVGLIYLLTGGMVLVGTLAPAAGAKVLNAEDVEEWREMRSVLFGSCAAFIISGIAMVALSLAAPAGPVAPIVAVSLIVIALVAAFVISKLQWDQYDELYRAISWEGSAYALGLLLPILFVWGALVQVGWLDSFEPLMVLAVAALLILVGTFIAAGRRGMLKQR